MAVLTVAILTMARRARYLFPPPAIYPPQVSAPRELSRALAPLKEVAAGVERGVRIRALTLTRTLTRTRTLTQGVGNVTSALQRNGLLDETLIWFQVKLRLRLRARVRARPRGTTDN